MRIDKITLLVVALIFVGLMTLALLAGLRLGRDEAKDEICIKMCLRSGWKRGEFNQDTLCRCWTDSTQEGIVEILRENPEL